MEDTFEDLKHEFLRVWAYYNPTNAAGQGWREFAGLVPDHSMEKINTYTYTLETFRKRLEAIDFDTLQRSDQLDYEILRNKIDSDLFHIKTMQSATENPMFYVETAFIFDYLLKDYAPVETRIQQLILHLEQLPNYYKVARNNLNFDEIAPELAEMAIISLSGMAEFLEHIIDELQDLDISITEELEQDLTVAGSSAAQSIMDYVTFLKSGIEDFSKDFRLGTEKYEQMLSDTQRVDISLDDILSAGEANLERNLEEFNKAANEIDPSKDPRKIIAEIKKNHPTEQSLIADTQDMLDSIRQFLIDSAFVSVPSDVMPKVVHTPKPYREWAFAAMNTPGALEKRATDSYYYITPPGEDWSDEEKEDWLQTFNYPGLLDICVHEAFPGHYLHHLHNQRSEYLMSKLFGAYHFWEGYALYVEEAMWEHGFQQGDPEYRMAQLVETLIRNVRLINSIKLHTDDSYTVEDATTLFMDKAFLGRKPAESEAKRGTFDPGYLNYALGKLMIEKLRADYKTEKGEEFNLKEFHDTLLSYGAPPVPILRKYMLSTAHDELL